MDQNVYTPEDKYYDYPDRPVPHDKRKSPINIAVVTTGMAVAMSTLYTGSALAEVMNFKEGTIAIVVGSVILAILASLTGGIGANEKILRTAARMAVAFSGEFTAVYVETTNSKDNEKIKNALHKNMKLARQLGAKVEIVYGDDISFQIAEFARLSGVTKIVIGRSSIAKNPFFRKPSLTEHLIADVPNLEVHIIPDSEQTTKSYRENKENHLSSLVFSAHDILWSIGILVLTSCIGLLFQRLQFVESNIIMVYVLGVLIISIVTKNQIYSLIASIVSVLIFNFLFTEPRFTLHAYSQGYPVTFVIMFVVSFLTGTLAVRLKNHAKSLAQSAFRTKVLFDTNQILQKVTKKEEIISTTAQQLNKLLGKSIVFYPVENETLGDVILFLASEDTPKEKYLLESEREAALWVLRNNKHAGASTQTFSEAECLYLAVRINDVVYGVIGIDIEKEPLDAFDHSIALPSCNVSSGFYIWNHYECNCHFWFQYLGISAGNIFMV